MYQLSFMDFIILILSIISVIIVYNLFDKKGFIAGLIFKLIFQTGLYILNGTFAKLLSGGVLYFIIALFILLIFQLILTAVEYFAYDKTNSFFGFFVLGIILEFLVLFAIGFLITMVGIPIGNI